MYNQYSLIALVKYQNRRRLHLLSNPNVSVGDLVAFAWHSWLPSKLGPLFLDQLLHWRIVSSKTSTS